METVLVSGDRGFIGSYIVSQLLYDGYRVVGIDDNSKYGRQSKVYDGHPNYMSYTFDIRRTQKLSLVIELFNIDYFIMGAAMIGGISYFHKLPYSLLATNEQIMASQFDASIKAWKEGMLKRVVVMSSSMVYEAATVYPTPEGHELECPPPYSSYGFQKLACEYFARAAQEEHGLPYTIVRPFNCVGIGEVRALSASESVQSGNISLAMSHVLPDLVQKLAKGQNPLHILGDGTQVRCYTYGADLARGIVTAMKHHLAINNDYNLSTNEQTSVLQLAKKVWRFFYPTQSMHVVFDEPFQHDVQMRVPDTRKAAYELDWKAKTSLDDVLEEVVPWVIDAVKRGVI